MSKISKLRSYVRRWGWRRTAFSGLMRIASRFLGLHVFVVRTKLATVEVDDPCEMTGLEYRRVDTESLMKWVDDPELDLDADFLSAASERGDIAFGVLANSVLIAYVWRSVKSAPHTGDLWVRVGRPYGYSYKSYTRPTYRGNHIVPALILYSDQEMLKLGYTHRAGFIAVTNYASLELGKHMGSDSIGYIGFLNWFGRYFFYRSRLVAEIGFEFFQVGK